MAIASGLGEQLAKAAYSDYIAIDATDIYWSSVTSGAGPGGIWRVGKDGTGFSSVATTTEPQGVAVDATCVYWSLDPIVGEIRAGPL